MNEFQVGDKVVVTSEQSPYNKTYGEITQISRYVDSKNFALSQAEVTYPDGYKVWVNDIYRANMIPRMVKKGYKTLNFMFLDRTFDDGWAEPFMVELLVSGDILREQLKDIGIQLSETVGLPCSEEGIEAIIEKYMEDNPGVIINYTIANVACVPYGGDSSRYKHWYQ